MGIIELDGNLFRKVCERTELLFVPSQDVLKGCRGEEKFLAQAQFLSGRTGIGWIKYAGDRLGCRRGPKGAQVVTCIEEVERNGICSLRAP